MVRPHRFRDAQRIVRAIRTLETKRTPEIFIDERQNPSFSTFFLQGSLTVSEQSLGEVL